MYIYIHIHIYIYIYMRHWAGGARPGEKLAIPFLHLLFPFHYLYVNIALFLRSAHSPFASTALLCVWLVARATLNTPLAGAACHDPIFVQSLIYYMYIYICIYICMFIYRYMYISICIYIQEHRGARGFVPRL